MFFTVTTEQLDAIIHRNRKADPNRKVSVRRNGVFNPGGRIDTYDSTEGILVIGGEEIKVNEIEGLVFVGKERETYEVIRTT